MSTANVIDVSRLSRYNFGAQAPLWWGFIAMILIESCVIATLVASYFYLKLGSVSWPPGGTAQPEVLLPTINTFLLLTSSVTMHWADKSIDRGEQRGLVYGLVISTVLAIVFLSIKAYEYSGLSYNWSTHSYGSIVWGISAFHSAHVFSIVLKTTVIIYLAIRGYFTQQRRLGITVNGLYWHFVVAAWIPLYFVLYWSPRFL